MNRPWLHAAASSSACVMVLFMWHAEAKCFPMFACSNPLDQNQFTRCVPTPATF